MLRRCCACRDWSVQYSSFTELLPTRAWLTPLQEDEEIEVLSCSSLLS